MKLNNQKQIIDDVIKKSKNILIEKFGEKIVDFDNLEDTKKESVLSQYIINQPLNSTLHISHFHAENMI